MDINNVFIALYDPANARNLTKEQVEAMKGFSDEQIDALAKAYPNTASGGLYLVYWDDNKTADKQLYQMGTWQNLRNLRKFNGAKNFHPFTFKSLFHPAVAQTQRQTVGKTPVAKTNVVDLSAQETAAQLRKTLKARQDAVNSDATGQEGQGTKAAAAPKRTPKKSATATTTQTSQPESEIPPDQQEQDFTDKSK